MTSLRAKIDGKTESKETIALAESEAIASPSEAVGSKKTEESLAEESAAKDSVAMAPLANDSLAQTGSGAIFFSVTLAIFWSGAAVAFLWGYYGTEGLAGLAPHLIAFASIAVLLPPFLFIACAFAFTRAQAMSNAASVLRASAERLTNIDNAVVGDAQRLGRAIRRELDTMSTGLDAALGRMRALENVLEDRIAQLDDANARADVKTQAIAQRLQDERAGIENVAESLDQAAARASESLAGRAAQLKTLMEQAGDELKSAGQLLDTQGAQFRDAAEKAAAAPAAAAIELDRQSKKIETAAEKATSRAEFVLGRQERQRIAMNELVVRLREESTNFEKTLETQKNAIERAAEVLSGEAKRFDELSAQGLQRVELAMESADERTARMAAGFGRDADNVKSASGAAANAMSKLIDSLREASISAHDLMNEATSEAKRRTKEFVGDAMESSDQLQRATLDVAKQAEKARAALAKAAEDAERHIVALPGVASQEAERVREAMRLETEKMLDMSARTLTTLQARASGHPTPDENAPESAPQEAIGNGLRGMAKRITTPKKRGKGGARSTFELSDVLAAAETPDVNGPTLKPSALSALGSVQAALADLASDLEVAMNESASPELWRRYLDGDRGVFARNFATSIGPETVDKIAGLYRDNARFHGAADAYLEEFELLLARALEGDRDGFLASTLLSADTGKVYLVVAYALGRLE